MITGTLLATLLCVAQPQTPPDTAKLDRFFDRLAEKSKAMGSLTIVKDGKVLYARAIGYGRIDGTEKDPLTAASRFRIGSITKMFTAAMVLQLVEEGKLKLTDTLDKFYPQVPNARTITVAHLLAHRSGVPNVRRDGRNVNTLPMGQDEMLALIAKGKPDFEPDTQHRYSNSGYLLLGLILEKVTGKPYGEALQDRITSKVGLKDTYLATGTIDVKKNEALTYIRLGAEWKPVPETHPSILFSAGGVVSTPGDLAKFAQALFDGKVVSKESLDRMRTIRDGDEMGMGMEQYAFAGKTFYGHAGGGDNYGAWLAYLPEEKLAVAYATNAKVYPVAEHRAGRRRHLLREAVHHPRPGVGRRPPGGPGQVRRRVREPRRAREGHDHPGRRDAVLQAARCTVRRPAGGDGREPVPDRGRGGHRVRGRAG